MIDTIKIWIECEPDLDMMTVVLDKPHRDEDLKTGFVTIKGKIKNLNITAKHYGVIISGSLSRYWNGTNALEFTRLEVQEAISELSARLEIPVETGKVWRFDMGSNLIVNEPASAYVNICDEARATGCYKRGSYASETALFYNSMVTIHLYDKKAEMRKKKEQIPERLQDKYVLRAEVQFKHRPHRQFGEKISAGTLYTPRFYRRAVDRWEQELLAIKMRRQRKLIKSASAKELDNQLLLDGTEYRGGMEAYLGTLREGYKEGLLDYQHYYRHSKKVRDLARSKSLTDESEAAVELKTKIQNAAAYHRLF